MSAMRTDNRELARIGAENAESAFSLLVDRSIEMGEGFVEAAPPEGTPTPSEWDCGVMFELEGGLDTEHMENLYAVFDVRCRNAFDKISRATPGSMPAKSLEEVSNDDSAENDDQVTDDSSDNV